MYQNEPHTLPIYSIKPLRRAQEAARRVIETMPSLAKEIPSDSLLKLNARQILQTSAFDTQSSHLVTEGAHDTYRKIGMNNQPSSLNALKQQLISHVDCNKKYNDLEVKYKQLEKDFYSLKSDERMKEQRYLKREQGFRKIIEQLENKIKSYLTVEEADKMKEINNLHGSILGKIDTFQAKTSKMLLDQEKDILKFFDVKISEVRQAYESEKIKFRENNKKFFEKEEQLIAEMDWIKSIAQKMDSKNQIVSKKYTDLKAQQSNHDEEDRLLKEVMKYKKKTTVLECQIEQYENIIKEFAKDKGTNISLPAFTLAEAQEVGQESKFSINPLQDVSQSDMLIDSRGDRSLVKAKYGIHDRSLPSTNLQSSRDHSPFKPQEVIKDQSAINSLKTILEREKKQKRMIKAAYVEELKSKSELNQILKECVEDLRSAIVTKRKEDKSPSKLRSQEENILDSDRRSQLIEQLVNNEKLLTILHDKTFHSRKKPLEKLPDFLLQDDDDDYNDDEF